MPYQLRNDDIITTAILLSFMLTVWAVSRSWPYLEAWWGGFFNEERKRKKFTKHLDVQLNGCVPIMVSASLMFGILVTKYVQEFAPEVFHEFTPQVVFVCGAGGILALIVLKLLLYLLVNLTFFNSAQAGEWTASYLVTLLFEAILLLPLSVAIVFLDLSTEVQQWWVLFIISGIEVLRLIKLKVIFFRGALGYVHIFLYFCTLNLSTSLVAWRLLTQIKLLLDSVK